MSCEIYRIKIQEEGKNILNRFSPLKCLLFSCYLVLIRKRYGHGTAVIYAITLAAFCLMLLVPAFIACGFILTNKTDYLIAIADTAIGLGVVVYLVSLVVIYCRYFAKKQFILIYESALKSKLVTKYPITYAIASLLFSVGIFFAVILTIVNIRFG